MSDPKVTNASETNPVVKIDAARNLLAYTASWYASGKNVLPEFAVNQLQNVEAVVANKLETVDTNSLLDNLDGRIDGIVYYGQEQVLSAKGRVLDVKNRVESAREQITNAGSGVYHRVAALPTEVTTSIQSGIDIVRKEASKRTVDGFTKVLDVSEASIELLLPEDEGSTDSSSEEVPAVVEATPESASEDFKYVPESLAPFAPRIKLLSKTVSKRVLKRVEAKLGDAPLKLRTNLEEMVHVNLLEYAEQFMGSVSSAPTFAYSAATAVSDNVKESVNTVVSNAKGQVVMLKDQVSGRVTNLVATASTPVEHAWNRVRTELLRLQAAGRDLQVGETKTVEGAEDENVGVNVDAPNAEIDEVVDHEALVLSELALALRTVAFPALMAWVSAQVTAATSRVAKGSTAAALEPAEVVETVAAETKAAETKAAEVVVVSS